ncbi:uncharacterized protein TA07165 [Theileria annulata]|uniref:Uncharacterized protein n=1 Tax=Theileria annulata TaxID=5874 RepID=Q4UAA9_THEAN|nr:uncharacterized protein TA07165 [Theileria annulata]CAI76244.1 hypothetical protein TA07165 [Theileria annulata]|eukprot:XP_952868.1 hypothetical protein TA07165 [Theileria annulata]
MVVYDDHIIWERESDENESFCYAILNYKYKINNVLFSHIVKLTQSDGPYVTVPCPDIEEHIKNSFYLLNTLHEHLDTQLQENSQADEQSETSTDDYQLSVFPITPPSETEPTKGTGETSASTEESNLSHPVANSEQSQSETQDQTDSLIPTSIQPEEQQEITPGTQEQQNEEEIHEQESFSTPMGNLSQEPTNEEHSQLETEDNTQSNDHSETCTIPNDSTLNGLYP